MNAENSRATSQLFRLMKHVIHGEDDHAIRSHIADWWGVALKVHEAVANEATLGGTSLNIEVQGNPDDLSMTFVVAALLIDGYRILTKSGTLYRPDNPEKAVLGSSPYSNEPFTILW